MATAAQRIIEQAKRLPAVQRRRVVSALEASLRPAALQRRGSASYESLIALAGSAHSMVSDVSGDKYAHLADAYGDVDA